ncbi:uncharacterized protein LOC112565555 [Pomacea canaliculata]|uniref:uncharacterized protein LOC112565555 n=1 Tax=Pomacea canaliculata TaxID=400727 RepID=UPI000D725ABC|nr:uncharacterized protein LOC112565555 [Pomacea canaliculata]
MEIFSQMPNSTDSKGEIIAVVIGQSEDIVSFETYEVFTTITQCAVKPVLFLVGIPSNVLNCVVFWRQGVRDPMNLCLFCLSLADLLHMTFLFVQSVIGPFVEFQDKVLGKEIYHKTSAYTKWFSVEMYSMSGCISLVIAVERCVCVMMPLRAVSIISTRTTGMVLAVIYVITQLGFIVNIFNYDVVAIKDNHTDQVIGWTSLPSKLWQENLVLFTTIQRLILLTILPFGIFVGLSVATAVTVVRLKAALLWRESTSSSSSQSSGQQRALTKMLVFVSCLHIVTAAPQLVFIITVSLVSDFNFGGRYENTFEVVAAAKGVSAMVNSSFTFVIYYRQSSRYRRALRHLCCWTKPGDEESTKCNHSTTF